MKKLLIYKTEDGRFYLILEAAKYTRDFVTEIAEASAIEMAHALSLVIIEQPLPNGLIKF